MITPEEKPIVFRWRDESHFAAHSDDFIVDPQDMLNALSIMLPRQLTREQRVPQSGEEIIYGFHMPQTVGYTGLRELDSENAAFWAFRKGRTYPSHLILGEKALTNELCLWGQMQDEHFLIHTLYPGSPAPREIHDPQLPIEDIDRSIDFWTKHAIIISEGDFFETA